MLDRVCGYLNGQLDYNYAKLAAMEENFATTYFSLEIVPPLLGFCTISRGLQI